MNSGSPASHKLSCSDLIKLSDFIRPKLRSRTSLGGIGVRDVNLSPNSRSKDISKDQPSSRPSTEDR